MLTIESEGCAKLRRWYTLSFHSICQANSSSSDNCKFSIPNLLSMRANILFSCIVIYWCKFYHTHFTNEEIEDKNKQTKVSQSLSKTELSPELAWIQRDSEAQFSLLGMTGDRCFQVTSCSQLFQLPHRSTLFPKATYSISIELLFPKVLLLSSQIFKEFCLPG